MVGKILAEDWDVDGLAVPEATPQTDCFVRRSPHPTTPISTLLRIVINGIIFQMIDWVVCEVLSSCNS